MKRKYFFLLCAFLMVQTPVMSQSMSTDQIIQYLQTETSKGTSQQTIIQNLVRRGVTVEQLRQARKKIESRQQQLGFVEDTGGPVNRMRTQAEERKLSTQERQQMLMEETADMGLPQNAPQGKRVFGRNLFNQKNLTFAPNQNMATPANYRLGAGDVVIIDVWGASQETFSKTISPDGVVTIEGVGPIKLASVRPPAACVHSSVVTIPIARSASPWVRPVVSSFRSWARL